MRKETKTTEPANTDRKCQDCKLLPFLVEFFFGVEVIFAIRVYALPGWLITKTVTETYTACIGSSA